METRIEKTDKHWRRELTPALAALKLDPAAAK